MKRCDLKNKKIKIHIKMKEEQNLQLTTKIK
jgi:hypothetical protein